MNRNNNKKLLYITVFVAALFVATISGTFAYFAASASDASTIQGGIADTSINLDVYKLQPKSNVTVATNGANLIPFDVVSTSGTVSSIIDSAIKKGCIDNDNYTACDVFKIQVSANTNLDINGYLKLEPKQYQENGNTKNSYIPNVKWILLKEKTTSNYNNIASVVVNSSYLIEDNIKPIGNPDGVSDGYIFTDLNTNDKKLSSTTSYYYVMVWVEDINDFQEDEGLYQGTVTFKADGNDSGKITATFGS